MDTRDRQRETKRSRCSVRRTEEGPRWKWRKVGEGKVVDGEEKEDRESVGGRKKEKEEEEEEDGEESEGTRE